MPTLPKKPCRPGCRNFRGECPVHANARPEYDERRGSAAARGYGRKWQEYAQAFRARYPVCATPGCGQPTYAVDHIVPHRGDQELFWRRSNHQPMCKGCHAAKSNRERLH